MTMNTDEAIAILREKLSHVTRDYRPEDQALDVLCKALRDADPVVGAAYRADHEKAVRQITLVAQRHSAVRGLSPENAINHLAFALDQALDAAAARWKPISEAPADETEVWAYNGEQGRMKWIEGQSENGESYGLWIWADELLSEVDPSPEQPTHFQPLPKPPEVE